MRRHCSGVISLFVGALLLHYTQAFAAGQDLVLADNQKTSWKIRAASPQLSEVSFAAAELQKYLQQITGAKFKASRSNNSPKIIVIGLRDDFAKEDQKRLLPAASGYDGYSIAVTSSPQRLLIAGDNAQGVIYGTYDFLERLGCRWFYPTQDAKDPEVVPQSSHLTVAVGGWSKASPIRFRICNGSAWFFETDAATAIQQVDWAMKNRYNMMGWQGDTKNPLEEQYRWFRDQGVLAELEKRGMFIHGPAHSFNLLLRQDDYMEAHPEWFGMRGGKRVPQTFQGAQFCWSNPDARKQMIANAEAFIKSAPRIKIFCPIPFDGGQACECDECKKIGASNLLMVLMAELIETLKTSCPDVLVETVGGYGSVTDPPTNLEIIHPQQRIVWAHWGRHHGMGYDNPRYDRRDNLEKWRKAAKGGLTICQYYTDNFAEPWVMGPFTVAMVGDRNYFLQHHIDSLYMLMWPRGYWWNHSLNGHIAGRCFYDVSIDPAEEIRDYALNYFGKDAGPLLAKYYSEWAENIDLSYRVRGDSRKKDRTMLAQQRTAYINPAVAGAKDEPLYAYRVSKVEKLHTLAESLTEGHHFQDGVRLLRKEGHFDEATKALEKARAHADKTLALLHQLADLNQGLIEKKEIPGFIQIVVKKWLDEEAKAIAAKDRNVPDGPWKHLSEMEMLPAEVTQ